MKVKPIDYKKNAEQFIELDGRRAAAPKDDEDFPIVAPPWAEATSHPGVMQEQCSACKALVGIAPTTQKIIAKGGYHPIVCRDCFEILRRMDAMGVLPPEFEGESNG
jgi:hypothetical protein